MRRYSSKDRPQGTISRKCIPSPPARSPRHEGGLDHAGAARFRSPPGYRETQGYEPVESRRDRPVASDIKPAIACESSSARCPRASITFRRRSSG